MAARAAAAVPKEPARVLSFAAAAPRGEWGGGGGEGHPWASPCNARRAAGGASRRACATVPWVRPSRSSPRISAHDARRPASARDRASSTVTPVVSRSSNFHHTSAVLVCLFSHPSAGAQRVCSRREECRRGPPPAHRCVGLLQHAPRRRPIKIDAPARSRGFSGGGRASPVGIPCSHELTEERGKGASSSRALWQEAGQWRVQATEPARKTLVLDRDRRSRAGFGNPAPRLPSPSHDPSPTPLLAFRASSSAARTFPKYTRRAHSGSALSPALAPLGTRSPTRRGRGRGCSARSAACHSSRAHAAPQYWVCMSTRRAGAGRDGAVWVSAAVAPPPRPRDQAVRVHRMSRARRRCAPGPAGPQPCFDEDAMRTSSTVFHWYRLSSFFSWVCSPSSTPGRESRRSLP